MPYYYESEIYRHPCGAIIQKVVRYNTATGKPVKERHYPATIPAKPNGRMMNLTEYFEVVGSSRPERKYKMKKNYILEYNYNESKVQSRKTQKMAKS